VITAVVFIAQCSIKAMGETVFMQRREASASKQSPYWFIFVRIVSDLQPDKRFSLFLLG
jgi:hypothetical protein